MKVIGPTRSYMNQVRPPARPTRIVSTQRTMEVYETSHCPRRASTAWAARDPHYGLHRIVAVDSSCLAASTCHAGLAGPRSQSGSINTTRRAFSRPAAHPMSSGATCSSHFFARLCVRYTQGEVTSHNLWSRYNRHFVGITWYNVWS